MNTMPFNTAINLMQWAWIGLVGLFTSTVFEYKDDLQKILVTVISMVLGTIASYYVKRYLNKKKGN